MALRCRRSGGVAARVLLCLAASLIGSAQATGTAVAAAAAVVAERPVGTAAVPADHHLRAAQRQAHGQPALVALARPACAHAAAPRTAALALQALAQAEAYHRAERAMERPRADRLLQAVVLRGCAAYHASRLQPGASHPVWWHTRLRIDSVRPAATGFSVQASAGHVNGPVAGSRITFARALHHACFVATDAGGQAACTMVDTHPHGGRPDAWAEAHEGPIIATLAGSVSPTRVELPAVEVRELPVFTSAPAWR
ncbi:MAG TPA: hypothetical protein PK756_09385 [Piscinibacter sp.]|nr:hypothetical protein [Piscinibacter sp.]